MVQPPFVLLLGTSAVPKPRARDVSLDSLIRSRWLLRYAPFSFDEKEMVVK